MTNVDRRIQALEAEVDQLRTQLAQANKAPAPLPPKVEEREVSVSRATSINPNFIVPNETQLRQLFDVAVRRFPILRAGVSKGRFAEQDERDLFNEFKVAFRGLGTIGRMPDGVDERWGADHWAMLIHSRGGGLVNVLPFTAAAIAHGDIAFRFDTNHMASSACFGLRDGGIAASDQWRHVLASNSTRDPLPMPFHRNYGGFVKATAG